MRAAALRRRVADTAKLSAQCLEQGRQAKGGRQGCRPDEATWAPRSGPGCDPAGGLPALREAHVSELAENGRTRHLAPSTLPE